MSKQTPTTQTAKTSEPSRHSTEIKRLNQIVLKEVTASGKDILEAKENARLALGADEMADVTYEILHAGSKGIFGLIGVKPAMVKASMEIPDPAPRRERRKETAPADTATPKAAEGDVPEKTDADAPRKNGNRRRRGGKGRGNNAGAAGNAPERVRHQPVEKATAVFESELKFEPREVKPGQDRSYDFICKLIEDLGIDAKVELLACDDGTRRIDIRGEAASLLIGHHGDTLDAVQYLANLASAQKNDEGEKDKSRVTVNIEGYRAKREETLRTLARAMSAKALRIRRPVMLEPMSPYERRIIHSEVQGIEGVYTNSVGSENNRKVVIYPERKPRTDDSTVASDLPETGTVTEVTETVVETVSDGDETV